MASIRAGRQTVLVVVDVQVGVMRRAHDASQVIANIAGVVERARAQSVPVIWVQHAGDALPYGSEDWQWVPELTPADGEARVYKNFNSAFEQTWLEEMLAEQGTTHIVLAGAATNWCIRATAYGALDRGYDLTLVSDAHSTSTIPLDDGSSIEAEDVIRDLNFAMQHLSYPDRGNWVVSAAELDFERLAA
jgi:nicotinamidase-related amidase